MQRPICETCGQRPRAINYYKDKQPYFRRKCEQCLKLHKPVKPLWVDSGYKVKRNCEACGFKPSIRSQVIVFYIDGNAVLSTGGFGGAPNATVVSLASGNHTLRIVGTNTGGPAGVAFTISNGDSFSGAPGGNAGPAGSSGAEFEPFVE